MQRVYLDTSVISHLDQPEKQFEQKYSLLLWESIINGEFDVWLSDVVFQELDRCKPDKAERLYEYLSQINYHDFIISEESKALADSIIERKFLPKNCVNDSRHIIGALQVDCDFLLSWNIKHLANYKTNHNIRLVAVEEFKHELAIIEPSFLLEGDYKYEERPTAPAGDK
jgi:predicted nucleic acid-binding protein